MPDEKECPECGSPMELDTGYDPPVWKCTNITCVFEMELGDDE